MREPKHRLQYLKCIFPHWFSYTEKEFEDVCEHNIPMLPF